MLGAQVFLIEAASCVLGAIFTVTRAVPSQRILSAIRFQHCDSAVCKFSLGVSLKEVTPQGVALSDGSFLKGKTVIWAAGLKAESRPAQPDPAKLPDGRMELQADLALRNVSRVYAADGLANAATEAGTPLPQLAAVAQRAGKRCAEKHSCVAELGKAHHQIDGAVAFVAWLGVHVALLTVPRAKLDAIVEWTWNTSEMSTLSN